MLTILYLVTGLTAFLNVVAGQPTYKRQRGCTSPVQRRSWTLLNDAEKVAYVNAVRCLQSIPAQYGIPGARVVWDELQYVHVRQSSFIHGVGAFLPWHRLYVKLHEVLLQRHCGFAGGVPYWNEAVDAANVLASPIWDLYTGMGGDGNVEANQCVTSGPFAGLSLVISGDTVASAGPPYCLSRAINTAAFVDTEQVRIDECFAISTYWEAMSCYGNAPHWGGHEGVGGTVSASGTAPETAFQITADVVEQMENAMLAPGDPIFFLHHANLDRLYWQWQRANPSIRLTEISGPNIPSGEFSAANGWIPPGPEFTQFSGDPAAETTLNHVLWTAGLFPNTTIGAVLDMHGEWICADYV